MHTNIHALSGIRIHDPGVRASEDSSYFFFLKIELWDFVYCGHYWPTVPPPPDRWWWLWRNWWNNDWQGTPKYSEKTCPSATLSTTNPTWLDPGLNPGRRGGKPATNRLSYGAAYSLFNDVFVSYTAELNACLWISNCQLRGSKGLRVILRCNPIMCLEKLSKIINYKSRQLITDFPNKR
jgi:hypothetical protein